LRQDRFKNRKARIVYEYETWHNQSTYMYPAMAKYFRAQGAQVATMWTYTLNGAGKYLGATQSHHLNLITTPRKAASFLVAREVFTKTPRYQPYSTTASDADQLDHAALSFPKNLSAYADAELVVHSGDIDTDFVKLPSAPQRIVGYGNSPLVGYQGKGLYFLDAVLTHGMLTGDWTLKVMPHVEFNGYQRKSSYGKHEAIPFSVEVDATKSYPITLRIPGIRTSIRVYRVEQNTLAPVDVNGPAFTFSVTPGDYLIRPRTRR
jgi:hypothetical protein